PLVALALYAASAALFWWSVAVTRGKLAACGSDSICTEVITQGPYRYIRHPFYAAYDLAWLAGFAATGWWPLAVTAAVMGALYESFAQAEERAFLSSPLAGHYAAYRRRTGHYVPFIHSARR